MREQVQGAAAARRVDEDEVARLIDVAQDLRERIDAIGVAPSLPTLPHVVDAMMVRQIERVALGHRRDAPVLEVAGERALLVVQIDGGDLVSALEQCDCNMHLKGRLAAATFVVAEQNHMRPGW